jgi:hypothetical protein
MSRKINHNKNVKTLRSIAAVRYMGIGEIVRFTYQKKNVTDSKPLVMIIHKEKDYVKGINLNYLTEYRVQQLLQEDIKIQDKRKKGKMLTNFRWYELYDQFIRTYQKDKIKNIYQVEYGKDQDAS